MLVETSAEETESLGAGVSSFLETRFATEVDFMVDDEQTTVASGQAALGAAALESRFREAGSDGISRRCDVEPDFDMGEDEACEFAAAHARQIIDLAG